MSSRNLISQTFTTLPLVVANQLPNMSLLSRTICRVRSKSQACPHNPLTISDLDLPNEYKLLNNKQFLLYDNKKENRILIFSTIDNLKILKNNKNWMADGTFWTVPKLFSQLYTIHVCHKNTTFPLAYILMTDR